MKNKFGWQILFCLLISFAVISCASAPPPGGDSLTGDTTPPPPPSSPGGGPSTEPEVSPDSLPPGQAELGALEAAAARAASLREMLGDFGASDLFPPEWDSAESLYGEAEQGKNTSTREEVRESVNRYNLAADAYESLLDRTISQYYESKLKELSEAREAAVNAGALIYAPDILLDGDDAADEALAKYEAKDYYAARDAAESALSNYNQALNIAYAADRRRLAEEALRRANAKVAESDEIVKNAELAVEGGLE